MLLLTINKLTDESGRYDNYSFSSIFLDAYIYHLLIILPFIPFIGILTKYLIEKKQKAWVIFLVHFLISLVFKPIAGFFPNVAIYIVNEGMIDRVFFEGYFSMFFRYAEYNIYIYIALVAITYTYYSFEKTKKYQIKQSQLSTELAINKLKALKSNLQPHFLFNTLNTVHVLIDEDKEKSKEVLVDLSNILREILDKNTEDKIELQDELSILNKYLNIIKTRYEGQLNITTSVDQGLEHALIPTLTIQQLVENAIKHGIDKNHKHLEIKIDISENINNLEVKVINDGKPLKMSFCELLQKGSGLKSINERFKVLYKSSFVFDVFNENKTVVNQFKIPLEKSIYQVG